MSTIEIEWCGGKEWDNTAPSMFNPNKKKSATEHLIETGGQTIEEAIETFDRFKNAPLTVKQFKPSNQSINWITQIVVEEKDSTKAQTLVNDLVEIYKKKQAQLKMDSSGYNINIRVNS